MGFQIGQRRGMLHGVVATQTFTELTSISDILSPGNITSPNQCWATPTTALFSSGRWPSSAPPIQETEQEGGRKDNASERAESRDQSQYLLGEQIASKADSGYPLS